MEIANLDGNTSYFSMGRRPAIVIWIATEIEKLIGLWENVKIIVERIPELSEKERVTIFGRAFFRGEGASLILYLQPNFAFLKLAIFM